MISWNRSINLLTAAWVAGSLSCGAPAESLVASEAVETTASAPTAAGSVPATGFSAVQVLAWSGAQCSLHPQGNLAVDQALPVLADDAGVAHFSAVHAAPGDAVTVLSLDCEDDTGRSQTFDVDLTSAATFQPIPAPAAAAVLPTRPALAGNPMAYSQRELLDGGYGIRPDPTTSPRGYELWLKAVSVPGHLVTSKGMGTRFSAFSTQYSLAWGGGILRHDTFNTEVANFTTPTVPFVDNSGMTIWGGMGGYTDKALLQDGVQIVILNGVQSIYAWREYYFAGGLCPQPPASCDGYNDEQFLFYVNAGDYIASETWPCDNQGNTNVAGGYGCFWIEDENTGMTADCHTPSMPCPSLPQLSPYVGGTAEAIVERNAGALSKFPSPLTITLEAYDTAGRNRNYANDDANTVHLVMRNSHKSTMVSVTTGKTDGTFLTWHRAN
jgi:hypothetical protein